MDVSAWLSIVAETIGTDDVSSCYECYIQLGGCTLGCTLPARGVGSSKSFRGDNMEGTRGGGGTARSRRWPRGRRREKR